MRPDHPRPLTEEELDCAIAVEALLRQQIAAVLAVELTVFSPRFEYAGTLDLWAMGRDRMNYILDWKSGRDVYPEHAVQLAAYANAEYAVVNKRRLAGRGEAWNGKLTAWGPAKAQRLAIAHVRPDGATLYPVNYSSRLWHAFRAAAFVKLWQLDTNTYNRTPREPVFGEPIEVQRRSAQTVTAAA